MEQLRIHKMKYRNRGVANRKLRGQQEYHVIFKFGTDKEVSDFITKVKEFWYALDTPSEKSKELSIRLLNKQYGKVPENGPVETVKDKVINALNEPVVLPEGISSKDADAVLTNALNKSSNEKPEVAEKPVRKRPGPAKGQGGRPVKKVVQG